MWDISGDLLDCCRGIEKIDGRIDGIKKYTQHRRIWWGNLSVSVQIVGEEKLRQESQSFRARAKCKIIIIISVYVYI